MYDFFVGLAGAVLVLLYWLACRNASLPRRAKAANAASEYMDRDDVTDDDRHKVGWFYLSMTKWYSLPLMTLFGFPIVFYGVFSGEMAKHKRDAEQDPATDAAWQMYVVRNPLTTAVCVTLMGAFIAIITPFSVLTNKVVPSLGQAYKEVQSKYSSNSSRHA